MPGRRNRPKPVIAVGEVLMWILFAVLLVPAGFVGWAIGHYTGHQSSTRTVTVSAPATTSATTTAAAPTTTAAASNATAAKVVFANAGCGACHTFKPAGASAKIGPDLDTAPEKDAKTDKMALTAFIKESIVDPNAYISPGFPKSVMPPNFAQTLGAAKVAELVSYIATDGK